jgi:hypothetical protein
MARDGSKVSLTLTMPREIVDAVQAESIRQFRRPGDVVADALRELLPPYIERQLRTSFARATGDGDVESETSP